jgi:hypothetical protein
MVSIPNIQVQNKIKKKCYKLESGGFDVFKPRKKKLFLDISSTNIDTLVPSLYQCVETRSIEAFWLLSQPLLYSVSTSSSSAKRLPPNCKPLHTTDNFQCYQEAQQKADFY